MDTTVCISEETNIYIRLIDRIKAPYCVCKSCYTRESNPNVWQRLTVSNKRRIGVGSKIYIDDPSWVMMFDELNVLKESSVVES